MPIWAAAIAGAASLAGGAMSANSAKKAASAANAATSDMSWHQMEFNSAEAAKARAFEQYESQQQMAFQQQANARAMEFTERMSNSAHQREMADLRAAGLNPILSGTGGMGSSTPGGASSAGSMARGHAASASAPQAQQARTLDFVSPAIASALTTANTLADISKKEAETSETYARIPTHEVQRDQIRASTDNVIADTRFKDALKSKTDEEVAKVKMETKRVIEEIYQTYWDGLSKREDVFLKKTQGRISQVEANTMEGLQDKHLTQILKAHPLVSDVKDIILDLLPSRIISSTISRGPQGTTRTDSSTTRSRFE